MLPHTDEHYAFAQCPPRGCLGININNGHRKLLRFVGPHRICTASPRDAFFLPVGLFCERYATQPQRVHNRWPLLVARSDGERQVVLSRRCTTSRRVWQFSFRAKSAGPYLHRRLGRVNAEVLCLIGSNTAKNRLPTRHVERMIHFRCYRFVCAPSRPKLGEFGPFSRRSSYWSF